MDSCLWDVIDAWRDEPVGWALVLFATVDVAVGKQKRAGVSVTSTVECWSKQLDFGMITGV